MSTTDRIAASRTVAASPAEVFRIVTDPAMHVEIDGSGMLEGGPRLSAAGGARGHVRDGHGPRVVG